VSILTHSYLKISKPQHRPLISPYIFRKVKPAISNRLAAPVAAERLYELRELRLGLVGFVFSVEKAEKGLLSTSTHCQRGGVEYAIQLTEKGVSTM
jgi:hypothetical protein